MCIGSRGGCVLYLLLIHPLPPLILLLYFKVLPQDRNSTTPASLTDYTCSHSLSTKKKPARIPKYPPYPPSTPSQHHETAPSREGAVNPGPILPVTVLWLKEDIGDALHTITYPIHPSTMAEGRRRSISPEYPSGSRQTDKVNPSPSPQPPLDKPCDARLMQVHHQHHYSTCADLPPILPLPSPHATSDRKKPSASRSNIPRDDADLFPITSCLSGYFAGGEEVPWGWRPGIVYRRRCGAISQPRPSWAGWLSLSEGIISQIPLPSPSPRHSVSPQDPTLPNTLSSSKPLVSSTALRPRVTSVNRVTDGVPGASEFFFFGGSGSGSGCGCG